MSLWKNKTVLCFLFLFAAHTEVCATIDVTLVGSMLFGDGIARQPIWIIDCLKDVLKVNWIPTSDHHIANSFKDVPECVKEIALKNNTEIGKVVLFTDHLWLPNKQTCDLIPETNAIKIASSMFDATRIPEQWVAVLNSKFDALVVPDESQVEIYTDSGVTIPIFVLPLGVYLEDFLAQKIRTKPHKPFVFGNTCSCAVRKNLNKLVQAFHEAFGNSPEVKLVLNCRAAEKQAYDQLKQTINILGATNIDFRVKSLSKKEYLKFMDSIDCYVSPSMGEGFAIPPREAMALGRPVILTDNTAHHTLCQSGSVRVVPSNILVPAYYEVFPDLMASFHDCQVSDLKDALLDVYSNYTCYFEKAKKSREWIKQYTIKALKTKYLSLLCPTDLKLGQANSICDKGLSISSNSLYKKYLNLTSAKRLR